MNIHFSDAVVINKGTYGTIYKAKFRGSSCAVKEISSEHNDIFRNETEVACLLRDTKGSVKVYKSFSYQNKGYMLMEFIESTLLEYCMDTPLLSESEKTAAILFYHICKAVEELHDAGVAHLDLKLENILIREFNTLDSIRLCDFGSSMTFVKNRMEPVKEKIGSPIYAAPELETSEKFYPPHADMWSLGVILHLLLVKCFPVTEPTRYISPATINWEHFKEAQVSTACWDLLKKLLKFNAKQRITIKEVLVHPWLMKYTGTTRSGCIGKVENKLKHFKK